MQERLQWIKMQPKSWVDWEPTRGGLQAHHALVQRYPQAQCFVVEPDERRASAARQSIGKPWWSPTRWRGPAPRFHAPQDATAQMVWANMALHMAVDPQLLMAQWQRCLAPGGFLMFSCLGPDSLREVRDLYLSLGWPPAAHAFTDMHDWGDMLVNAGFAEPVMDMERLTLTFDNAPRLLQELRSLGRNLHRERFGGLRGRLWREQLLLALGSRTASPEGKGALALTFEVIYGHALRPLARLDVQAQTVVTLEQMRVALRQGKAGPDHAR